MRQQHRGAAWCKLVGLTTVVVLTAFADPGGALGQSERGSVAGYDFKVNVRERLIPPRRPPELVRVSESLSWLHVDGDRPGGDGVTRVLDISFGRAEGRRGATLSLAASGAVLEASGRITINARPSYLYLQPQCVAVWRWAPLGWTRSLWPQNTRLPPELAGRRNHHRVGRHAR